MIELDDNRKIAEIQEKFSLLFPFLKLVFYNVHTKEMLSNERAFKPRVTTLGMYRKNPAKKANTISPINTVAELEGLIMNHYDLFVQVLRKSGKAWLETSVTGAWTLEKQNREGELLCTPFE